MLADARDIAIAVVAHLTKDETRRLINRVTGAGAFVNAARSVLALARDPNDPKGEQGHDRVLVHAASNWGALAPTLSLTVEARDVDTDDGERTNVGYLTETGESDVSVEDLQGGHDEGLAANDCEEEIGQELKGGKRSSREVKKAVADSLGCSRKTVERTAMRMRDRGDLSVEEGGFPRTTTWALVASQQAGQQ